MAISNSRWPVSKTASLRTTAADPFMNDKRISPPHPVRILDPGYGGCDSCPPPPPFPSIPNESSDCARIDPEDLCNACCRLHAKSFSDSQNQSFHVRRSANPSAHHVSSIAVFSTAAHSHAQCHICFLPPSPFEATSGPRAGLSETLPVAPGRMKGIARVRSPCSAVACSDADLVTVIAFPAKLCG